MHIRSPSPLTNTFQIWLVIRHANKTSIIVKNHFRKKLLKKNKKIKKIIITLTNSSFSSHTPWFHTVPRRMLNCLPRTIVRDQSWTQMCHDPDHPLNFQTNLRSCPTSRMHKVLIGTSYCIAIDFPKCAQIQAFGCMPDDTICRYLVL